MASSRSSRHVSLQTFGHWHVYHNRPKLDGGFVYHNRAKLEGGFWNKEAQYPMKPAEAGSDLGGQREKGGGHLPLEEKRKWELPDRPDLPAQRHHTNRNNFWLGPQSSDPLAHHTKGS